MHLPSAAGLTDGHPASPGSGSEQRPHGDRCHPVAGQLELLECSFLKLRDMHKGPGMSQTSAGLQDESLNLIGPQLLQLSNGINGVSYTTGILRSENAH